MTLPAIHLLSSLAVLAAPAAGCSAADVPEAPADTTADPTPDDTVLERPDDLGGDTALQNPVWVTFAAHIEDVKSYADCPVYWDRRESLLGFAELLHDAGVGFNLQVEYEWFLGALDCETTEVMASTGGMNVLVYLATELGVEIDAHQEGAWEVAGTDNYADVHYLGSQVVPDISDVVGGVKWDDPGQVAALQAGETGWLHPDYTWNPTILTLGVGTNHHLGDFDQDDLTSGVWRPKGGGEDFFVHDDEAALIYIGPGQQHGNWNEKPDCLFWSSVDYVQVLATYIADGTVDADAIYTASIAIPQSVMFDDTRWHLIEDRVAQLEVLTLAGQVEHATYTEVAEAWADDYDSEPNLFAFEDIHPDDYTCDPPEDG